MAVQVPFPEQVNWFKHLPLDLSQPTIRLFKIRPGSGVIGCDFHHTTKLQDYTGLSYVCGPRYPKHRINVNDDCDEVSENLFDILTELRRQSRQDEFWVDAICIDQSNYTERNHQVSQMAQIYKNASEVLYCLGPASPAMQMSLNHVASKVILDKLRDIPVHKSWQPDLDDGIFPLASGSVAKIQYLEDSQREQVILQIHRLPWMEYFRRTWVVQEVIVSMDRGTVMIGSSFIPWRFFWVIMAAYSSMSWTLHVPTDCPLVKFISAIKIYQESSEALTLGDSLRDFGGTECSDRRDRIFALRSLLDDPTQVTVDYRTPKTYLSFKVLLQQIRKPLIFTDRPARGWAERPGHSKHDCQTKFLIVLLIKALEIHELDFDVHFNPQSDYYLLSERHRAYMREAISEIYAQEQRLDTPKTYLGKMDLGYSRTHRKV